MSSDISLQTDSHPTDEFTEIPVEEYLKPLEINADWLSYRHPDYPLNSASLQEGRFNFPGETAYYMASGSYCAQFEVPNHAERIPCGITSQTIYAFDLPAFATDYGHGQRFIQQQNNGGWEVCQEFAGYLTNSHSVSGILYESAACHKSGQFGYCLVVLPNDQQALPNGFFIPPSDSDFLLDR